MLWEENSGNLTSFIESEKYKLLRIFQQHKKDSLKVWTHYCMYWKEAEITLKHNQLKNKKVVESSNVSNKGCMFDMFSFCSETWAEGKICAFLKRPPAVSRNECFSIRDLSFLSRRAHYRLHAFEGRDRCLNVVPIFDLAALQTFYISSSELCLHFSLYMRVDDPRHPGFSPSVSVLSTYTNLLSGW